MRTFSFSVLGFFFALSVLVFSANRLVAQQLTPNQEDNMKADEFSRILKDEWSYLKDATDEYLASIAKKSEFETTNEFGERAARLKSAFVNKVNSHIKEKKLDKRVFGILFKVSLVSYNADLQQFRIASSETVEAPYDIPTLRCIVPLNSYVVLADSVNRGFRSSALRIRFPAAYRWKISRDEAKAAKEDEPNLYFRIRFVLDLSQEDMAKQAKFKMIPTQIAMISLSSKKVYWTEDIK